VHFPIVWLQKKVFGDSQGWHKTVTPEWGQKWGPWGGRITEIKENLRGQMGVETSPMRTVGMGGKAKMSDRQANWSQKERG